MAANTLGMTDVGRASLVKCLQQLADRDLEHAAALLADEKQLRVTRAREKAESASRDSTRAQQDYERLAERYGVKP